MKPAITQISDSPKVAPAMQDSKPSVGPMRAIVQDAYGSSDVMRLGEIDRPEIASNEVLVEVVAAGMDRGTWHVMAGKPYLMRIIGYGFRRPKNPVPGLDVAGTVAAVGSEVTRFKPGDEVFGMSRGSFAEFAAVLEDKLAHKPVGLTFEEAAVVPISGGTALQALRDSGNIEPGQNVLIIGASGGVGTYAVQLAKAMGAEVTGVSSTTKLELVRSIGADHVIDYTREDYLNGSRRYDLILDIGGNNSLSRLRRALKPEGTLVIVGGEEGGNLTGGLRPAAPCASPISIRGPATDDVGFQGASHRPRSPGAISRERTSRAVHRQGLLTGRSPRCHDTYGSRAGAREDRHHHLSANRPN